MIEEHEAELRRMQAQVAASEERRSQAMQHGLQARARTRARARARARARTRTRTRTRTRPLTRTPTTDPGPGPDPDPDPNPNPNPDRRAGTTARPASWWLSSRRRWLG